MLFIQKSSKIKCLVKCKKESHTGKRLMIKFEDLGLSQQILSALGEMGFEKPTEVQEKAIPHILNKEDIIVMSKTGSGKTAVFGIPLLQLTEPGSKTPQCLILTPTRELAVQIENDIKEMGKHLSHKITSVYGQHNINTEVQVLAKGVDIVAGTPGRVFDHIEHGNMKLDKVRFLVLDEADRMLDMGFIDQVKKIVKKLPAERTTLLFSATIPSEIKRICTSYMKDPVTVEIESPTMTVDTINQVYYKVNRNEKCRHIENILIINRPNSCIIFCNTKIAVDMVQRHLGKNGFSSCALHGDIPQSKRMQTINQFKQGKFHILVATDVAARGIHIEDLSLVINFDVPSEKDSYVHRIGRTGRAGKDGKAITLATSNDIMALYEIEEHIGTLIPEGDLPLKEEVDANIQAAAEWKAQKPVVYTEPEERVKKQDSGNNRSRNNSRTSSQSRKPNSNIHTDTKQRPAEVKDNKTPRNNKSSNPSSNNNRQKPYNKNYNNNYNSNKERTDRYSRPAQETIQKPVQPVQPVQTAAVVTEPKKSVFSKIFGKLFGKNKS